MTIDLDTFHMCAKVAATVGLHARPAAVFVEAAAAADFAIQITGPSGKTVNAGSILSVLALGVQCGETVTVAPAVAVNRTGAPLEPDHVTEALNKLVAILEQDHDV